MKTYFKFLVFVCFFSLAAVFDPVGEPMLRFDWACIAVGSIAWSDFIEELKNDFGM